MTGRLGAELTVHRLPGRPFCSLAPGLMAGDVKEGLLVPLKGDFADGVQVLLLLTSGVTLDESKGETLLCGEVTVGGVGLLELKEDLRLVCDSVSYAGGEFSCDAVRCRLPIGGLVDTRLIVFPATEVWSAGSTGGSTDISTIFCGLRD